MPTTLEAMVAAAKAVVPSLTANDVQATLQAGESVIILDVREHAEYEQGHSAQATLLPRGLSGFRIGAVVPETSTTLILH